MWLHWGKTVVGLPPAHKAQKALSVLSEGRTAVVAALSLPELQQGPPKTSGV